MNLLQSKTWISKPPLGSQINWSHPLSRSLVGAWLMNEGGGLKVIDLSKKRDATSTFVSGGYKTGGIYLNSGAAKTEKITLTNSYYNQERNISLVVKFKVIGAPINSHALYNSQIINTSGGFYLRYDTTGTLTFLKSQVASVLQGTTSGYVVGKTYCFALTVDGSGNCALYENNKQLATGTTVLTFTRTTAMLGIEGTNASWDAANGIFYHFYIYNRALSSSEIQQLYASPYCFIYRPTNRLFSIPSAPPVGGRPRRFHFIDDDSFWGY